MPVKKNGVPQKQNGGRPLIQVDEQLLMKLSKLHLSDKVIADILKMSVDTLHNRFSEKIEFWKSESKGKIAEVLFDEGVNNREPWALKALAQKHLDYHDRIKAETVNHNMNDISDEDLDSKIDEKLKKLKPTKE